MLRGRLRRWRALRAQRPDPDSPGAAHAPAQAPGALSGERGVTLAIRSRSLQARLNALLAGALALGVAGAMLTWYYSRVLHERSEASGRHAVVLAADPVGAPPPLGVLPAPRVQSPANHSARGQQAPSVPLAMLARWAPMRAGHPAFRSSPARAPHAATARGLRGAVLIEAPARADLGRPESGTTQGHRGALAPRGASHSRLHALLRATPMSATQAKWLPDQRLLLAQGTFIDCTLETAIDSTLPGMTLCITSTDTFSADGTVVLLPRGTLLIGQTRGEVRQGMARLFVIWTQARTPAGVIVPLDSPATDALGRSGLSGTVNVHFWQRFGAALLVSTLTGLVQSQVQRSANAVILDPSAGENVLSDTLRGTEDIPPTIEVPNGQRIEVLVARDVDFRSVYALHTR